jgi:hypothetical protein
MVKAIVNISQKANRVINVVKAKYDFRDKSQAINKIVEQFDEFILEPELRPEYIRKMNRIQKEPILRIGTVKDFKKRYGLK